MKVIVYNYIITFINIMKVARAEIAITSLTALHILRQSSMTGYLHYLTTIAFINIHEISCLVLPKSNLLSSISLHDFGQNNGVTHKNIVCATQK